MSSIFHSSVFWVGLLIVAALAAAGVCYKVFRQMRKDKKQPNQQVTQPKTAAKWQYPKLSKFLQFLRSSTAPKQQAKASPIANVVTKVAPIKPGDVGSRVALLDAELTRVKEALHGNIEASQLELGLLTHLTDEVEEIKKVLVQWGFLGETLAEKEPESDRERNAREWREALVEQVDIWREAENLEAANVDNEEPANTVRIAPPILDTTSAGARIHARLEKETMATSRVAVPVDGISILATIREMRKQNSQLTQQEALKWLLNQKYDFKGKQPWPSVHAAWMAVDREEKL